MPPQDWERAAQAWIAAMGAEEGDWARQQVIDPALERHLPSAAVKALDVGCGEGRLCRKLAARGVEAIGVDPTPALLDEARRRHPEGDYRPASAEQLPFDDGAFDLVVSCLTLIDIEDVDAAADEMTRVLRPGGALLLVNLTSFNTAGAAVGWRRDWLGRKRYFPIDDYLTERPYEIAIAGVRIINRHRPLSRYMQLFLDRGLVLTAFEEPEPADPAERRAQEYVRAPWFNLMKWTKPG